jgi:hypothetical protein
MATRLRWFVKKRGQRRTGSRWYGTLGVAALDLALVLIGVAGLYWLLAHVLWSQGEPHGWLAWAAVVIPLAPIGYGVTDLVVLVWRSLATTERRAAVAQMASDWELPGLGPEVSRPTLPAVPPIDSVVDSAGVRLAFRLPSDAASGQMSFALAAVCVVWNTLVIVFGVRVVQQHWTGPPNWLLTWMLVPLALAGGWTIYALVRQVLLTTGTGTTLLEVSEHPLYPGRSYEAFLSQTGRLQVRWFQVQLVCEERATYPQGTDTRTANATVYRAPVLNERKFEIPPGGAFEKHFNIAVPGAAMHSFSAPHNAVSWMLVVRGRMARWPEFERHFPLYVYPQPPVSPSDPHPTATRRAEQDSA